MRSPESFVNVLIKTLPIAGLVALSMLSAPAVATDRFSFDLDTEGWTNQATEPFSVLYSNSIGFGGPGSLSVEATSPRDSFQLVHSPDPDWPATPFSLPAVAFDVLLGPGVRLNLAVTGMQFRDSFGESNVYSAVSTSVMANGWMQVVLAPTTSFELPQSHADVGLNLHLGTTSPYADMLVMTLDNVRILDVIPPVPEPPTAVLCAAAMLPAAVWLRRRVLKHRDARSV